MKKIFLISLFIIGCWDFKLHAEEDLYVDAFSRFIKLCLLNIYEKGDTICVKEVFGITEKFPKEIEGFPIQIINEFNCYKLPQPQARWFLGHSYPYTPIYYIYPMRVYCEPSKDDLIMAIGINDGLAINKKGEFKNGYLMGVYVFEYIFDKEEGYIHFWRQTGGVLGSPVPWYKR